MNAGGKLIRRNLNLIGNESEMAPIVLPPDNTKMMSETQGKMLEEDNKANSLNAALVLKKQEETKSELEQSKAIVKDEPLDDLPHLDPLNGELQTISSSATTPARTAPPSPEPQAKPEAPKPIIVRDQDVASAFHNIYVRAFRRTSQTQLKC